LPAAASELCVNLPAGLETAAKAYEASPENWSAYTNCGKHWAGFRSSARSGLDATDERDIEPALARYDTEQRRFGGSLVARARHPGAYLEAHSMQNEEEGR
jgi:hypothetical protein